MAGHCGGSVVRLDVRGGGNFVTGTALDPDAHDGAITPFASSRFMPSTTSSFSLTPLMLRLGKVCEDKNETHDKRLSVLVTIGLSDSVTGGEVGAG